MAGSGMELSDVICDLQTEYGKVKARRLGDMRAFHCIACSI